MNFDLIYEIIIIYLCVGLIVSLIYIKVDFYEMIESTEQNKYLMDFLEDYPAAISLARLFIFLYVMIIWPRFLFRKYKMRKEQK